MDRQEKFLNYNFIGYFSQNQKIRGMTYTVYVEPDNLKNENEFLFIEETSISDLAIKTKYGSLDFNPKNDLLLSTFSKAKARLILDLFDNGKEFNQTILTDNIVTEFKAMSDNLIKKWILKGLTNLRKSHPLKYDELFFEIDGFCEILAIDKNQFLYNLSILLEDDLIRIGESKDYSIENGGFNITSSGIREYENIMGKNTDISEAKKTEIIDDLKKNKDFKENQYDIVISFAGENRNIADELAKKLKERNITVFYDSYEEANLWGKDIYEYLSYIYGESAKFCIMIISEHYKEKLWTNHERKSAQARAFREKSEYILPIKVDDTIIPGLNETVGYIKFENNIDKIVELTIKKLNENN